LNFTVDRLTPGFKDYGAALNLLGQLDADDALTISVATAGADDDTPTKIATGQKSTITVQTAPSSPKPHNALVLYVQPYSLRSCDTILRVSRLWAQLLYIYRTVRTTEENAKREALDELLAPITGCRDKVLTSRRNGRGPTEAELIAALQRVPSIELRTDALKPAAHGASKSAAVANTAPFLRLRSAYGIFRSIDVSDYSPDELIEVVSPEDHAELTGMPWDDGQQFHLITFQQYCQTPPNVRHPKCKDLLDDDGYKHEASDRVSHQICVHGLFINKLADSRPMDKQVQRQRSRWAGICLDSGKPFTQDELYAAAKEAITDARRPLLTMSEDDSPEARSMNGEDRRFLDETALQRQRRYVFIVQSQTLPAETFAWTEDDDGTYYYIAKDDYISQKNFRFLSLISTIQAVAPGAPLTPTLQVGGH